MNDDSLIYCSEEYICNVVHIFHFTNIKSREMKRILLISMASLLIALTAKSQNLFFFGENSYPCTETIKLQSNSYSSDLHLLFAKDGKSPLIGVSTHTVTEVLIKGKLIIYLADGTVITCDDNGEYDLVDNIASTIYYLTDEQLSRMKTSNIHTVRFTLKSSTGFPVFDEGSYSASNSAKSAKMDVPSLIADFFK